MAEPKRVDFKPRWMSELTEEDRRVLDAFSHSGSLAEVPPRINARILPQDGSHSLSAKALSEAIGLTQAIVQYAGYDVYHGVNPDFADLRSLSSEVVALTRLTIEPFEEGSFVIPTRLEASPLAVADTTATRQITAEDVVKRFDEILASLQQSAATQVSIGAIQAIEALGRVIRREAQAVEFASFDAFGQPRQSLRVDEGYIACVHRVRLSRQPTRAKLETLEGQVTAIDIREGKLQLSIEGQRRRVQGSFSMLLLPSLMDYLGCRVKLEGYVEWKGKIPVSIQVLAAEVPSDD